MSKDVCFVEGCLPVPRVRACSSGASLFLACKPVPRVQACSSGASLFEGCGIHGSPRASRSSARASQSSPKAPPDPPTGSPRASPSYAALWGGSGGSGLVLSVKTCGFRTIWNSSPEPREPRDPGKWWQDPRLGPPHPTRAGGQDDGSYTNSLKIRGCLYITCASTYEIHPTYVHTHASSWSCI